MYKRPKKKERERKNKEQRNSDGAIGKLTYFALLGKLTSKVLIESCATIYYVNSKRMLRKNDYIHYNYDCNYHVKMIIFFTYFHISY